jgi:orotate phosphoribosyltransferase-like protein
MTSALEDLS